MGDEFEPVIVGFLCNWCAYRAADLVGTSRFTYAANMRSVRVMCSGRVSPELVLKAFWEGADGVMVIGCHPGACHYVNGNLKSAARLALLRRTLAQLGIDECRMAMARAAASEGRVLAKAVDEMTAGLRTLGPLRWRERFATLGACREKGKDRRRLRKRRRRRFGLRQSCVV
jgi:F420-non-reducing hydrogenase iron-sulfur subunit